MSKQFIYVLHSESMPQSVKIGYSNNCKARVTDINRESELPFPLKLVKKWEVSNAYKLEQEVHRHLDFCRVAPNKEFFTIPPQKAVEVIDKIVNDGAYEFFTRDPLKPMVKVTDTQSLGKLIKRERKHHKLTQKQLAFAECWKKCNKDRSRTCNCCNRNHFDYFMVHDYLWKQSGLGFKIVCISCFEAAIGRKIDFEKDLSREWPGHVFINERYWI